MSEKNQMTVSGSISELDVAWGAWLERVPEDERIAVADIVDASDLSSLHGINKLAQKIVSEMLRGNVSPVVASAAKPWIELVIFNISQMHAQSNTQGGALTADIAAALIELRSRARPLRAVYTVVDRGLPEAIEAEPELIEAEKVAG